MNTVTAIRDHEAFTDSGFRVMAAMLVAIGDFTTRAGARTEVICFEVCPALLTTTAGPLAAGRLV